MMIKKFCFCFKQKTAAVLMAVVHMVVGVMGTVVFSSRLLVRYDSLDEDYLVFCVFCLFASSVISSGIIWEIPSLLLAYEILEVSILAAFTTHAIIFVPHRDNLIIIFLTIGLLIYSLHPVYCYYKQLKLKRKSSMRVIYFIEPVYFTNKIVV